MIRGRQIPLFLPLLLLPLLIPSAAIGQDLRLGTTYAIPADQSFTEQDLKDMQAAGFGAVRLAQIATTELLTLADTLGIQVYQDLPIRAVPADLLADTLAAARAILGDVVAATHRHPSLRAIGLADLADTSDPIACQYIAELGDIVRSSAAAGTISYFTTKFIESDQCTPTTEMVLVDLLDADSARIGQAVATLAPLGSRVGVAALGTWTDLAIKNRGLRHERSPESQARYLERALQTLSVHMKRGSFPVVFVHRWRDPIHTDDVFSDMVQRRYGLHNSANGRRPSFDVASGFATGSQKVFAFPTGRKSTRGWMWMTLLGWGVLGALGIAYATSPRMRHMVPRYFLAHAFYRDAVISGRESLVSETLVLLGAVSGGVGMLSAILVKELSVLPAFSVGKVWLAPDTLNFIGALMDQPWTLTVILASGHALMSVVWISILSLLTRSRQTLLPAQVMMLVIWPQWPLIIFLLVSPAIASADAESRLFLAAVGFGVAALLIVLSGIRTTFDYRLCSRVSPGFLVLGLMLHPIMIWLVVAIVVVGRHSSETDYLWHLLTRG